MLTERNSGEMTNDVVLAYYDGCCTGSEVDKCATRAFLCVGEDVVCQLAWCKQLFGNFDVGVGKAIADIGSYGVACDDVKVFAFDVESHHSDWVGNSALVDSVFLWKVFKYLAFRIWYVIAFVAYGVDDFACDVCLCEHVAFHYALV